MSEQVCNWAGNITFAARTLARPKSIAELQELVRAARKVRVLGSGHSFNAIADTDDTLISLRDLPRRIEIDIPAQTVTIDGGAMYAEVAPALHAAGSALANVASLPNISVAGAVATATHGSGDTNKNLSAAVSGLKLVTASGDIVALKRGDADFDGAVVNLGALGVMAELTLDLVPSFDIRQTVYLDLPVKTVIEYLDALTSGAYSVRSGSRHWPRPANQRPTCLAPCPPPLHAIPFPDWTVPPAPASSACPAPGMSDCFTLPSAMPRLPVLNCNRNSLCRGPMRPPRSRPCTMRRINSHQRCSSPKSARSRLTVCG
jgi:hypothetical protein